MCVYQYRTRDALAGSVRVESYLLTQARATLELRYLRDRRETRLDLLPQQCHWLLCQCLDLRVCSYRRKEDTACTCDAYELELLLLLVLVLLRCLPL